MSTDVGRRVVCAANRSKTTGKIILGVRHWDNFMHEAADRGDQRPDEWTGCDQGFVDQYGVFMSREEALEIAKENAQIIRRCGGDNHRLYSENLY